MSGARVAVIALTAWALLALVCAPAGAATVVRVGVYDTPPLILLSEDGMPRGLVIDVLEYVAAQEGWTMPVIMLAGHPMEAQLRGLEAEAGLDGWLLKPPDLRQLSEMVAQALQQEA